MKDSEAEAQQAQASEPTPTNAEVAAEAQAAREENPVAESMQAAQQMAEAQGGNPLPDAVRRRLERSFDTDLSQVRIFDGEAGDRATRGVQAGAATLGQNIFFRSGRFDPSSRDGMRLLAHELTHVRQVSNAAAVEDVRVGATGSPAEHEAEEVAEAVARGDRAPSVSSGHHHRTVRRGEAGVHQGIEMQAAGLGAGPRLAHNLRQGAPGQGTAAQGALQIYSGNFMRDLSQLNVPLVINAVSQLPRQPVNDPQGAQHGRIGARGALSITSAVVRALGVLELGQQVVAQNVNAQNIGPYRHQEHIDNPMGGSIVGDITVMDTLGTSGGPARVDVPRDRPQEAHGGVRTASDGREAQRNPQAAAQVDLDLPQAQGAAIPGLQVENPELYRVSGSGLQNHIYNSVEYAKNEWVQAARLGATPQGRMHFGSGLHTVEDYFSHSNFIEVALNTYIDRAIGQANRRRGANVPGAVNASTSFIRSMQGMGRVNLSTADGQAVQGRWVDTLYDATVPAPGARGRAGQTRQAVTTGSFGGTDTRVSIAHVLLPRLPQLQDAILKGVDKMCGLVAQPNGPTSWNALVQMLGEDRPGAAVKILLEGFDGAGITLECPTGVRLTWGSVQVTPSWLPFVGAREIEYPNGWEFVKQQLSLTQAITFYTGLYRSAQDVMDTIRSTARTIRRYLLGPLSYIYDAMMALVDAIQRQLDQVRQRVVQQIKGRLTAALISMVNGISGGNLPQSARENLGDAMEYAHHAVEAMEHETSLESRLRGQGDLSPNSTSSDRGQMTPEQWQRYVESRVGPVRLVEVNGQRYFEPINRDGSRRFLPPSHSEVGKDHPGEENMLETSANPNTDAQPGRFSHREHGEGHEYAEAPIQERNETARHFRERRREHARQHAAERARVRGQEHPEAGGRRDTDHQEGETAGTPGNAHEHGSVFYGLHRSLAVEADKHVMAAMQAVWGDQSLLGDGNQYQMQGDQVDQHGETTLRVDSAGMHSTILGEARTRATSEQQRAQGQGFGHAQSGRAAEEIRRNPAVADLLNLADYFMSHPDDSSWWRTIFDSYIGAHEDEVLDHIRDRNQTRGARVAPAGMAGVAVRAAGHGH